MTSELRRRLLVTVGGLVGVWALQAAPLPGLAAAFGSLMDPGGAFGAGLRLTPFSLGALGIWPYVVGCWLATLIQLLRGPAHRVGGARSAAWTREPARLGLVLALGVALLQGHATAIFLENIGAFHGQLVAHPGPLFEWTTALTLAGATALTAAVANLVTRYGLGNGVVLLMGLSLVDRLVRATVTRSADAAPWPVVVVLAVAWLALATWWLGLRWRPVETGGPARAEDDAPAARAAGPGLHVSGVGIIGVTVTASILQLPVMIAGILSPSGALPGLADRLAPGSLVHFAASVLVAVLAMALFTAWAYDPAGIRRVVAGWPGLAARPEDLPDERAIERRLDRVALLSIVGVPLACALFTLLAWRAHAPQLSAASLVVVAAIVLDLSRHWRSHRRMALDTVAGGEEVEDVAAGDEAPEGDALVEGWAPVAEPATRLEAEVAKARLAEAGIEAEVLSSTFAPAYGSLGVFETQPLVPLLVHSRCGGGSVRLLVRPVDRSAAALVLEAKEDGEPA